MIIYTDNGNVPVEASKGQGMGLSNIEQRVRMLNGTITQCKTFKEGAFYHITFQNKHIFS